MHQFYVQQFEFQGAFQASEQVCRAAQAEALLRFPQVLRL
jgi:hypothetical protein